MALSRACDRIADVIDALPACPGIFERLGRSIIVSRLAIPSVAGNSPDPESEAWARLTYIGQKGLRGNV